MKRNFSVLLAACIAIYHGSWTANETDPKCHEFPPPHSPSHASSFRERSRSGCEPDSAHKFPRGAAVKESPLSNQRKLPHRPSLSQDFLLSQKRQYGLQRGFDLKRASIISSHKESLRAKYREALHISESVETLSHIPSAALLLVAAHFQKAIRGASDLAWAFLEIFIRVSAFLFLLLRLNGLATETSPSSTSAANRDTQCASFRGKKATTAKLDAIERTPQRTGVLRKTETEQQRAEDLQPILHWKPVIADKNPFSPLTTKKSVEFEETVKTDSNDGRLQCHWRLTDEQKVSLYHSRPDLVHGKRLARALMNLSIRYQTPVPLSEAPLYPVEED